MPAPTSNAVNKNNSPYFNMGLPSASIGKSGSQPAPYAAPSGGQHALRGMLNGFMGGVNSLANKATDTVMQSSPSHVPYNKAPAPTNTPTGSLLSKIIPTANAQTTDTAPGSPQSATNQQQADMAKYFPNGTGSTTSNPPTGNGTPAGTQPAAVGNGRVDSSGTYANASNASPQAINYTGNSNTSSPVPVPVTPYAQSYGGQVNIGQGKGTGNPGFYQSWLQNVANNQTPAVTQAQNEYNQFAKASPYLLSDVRNNPNVAAEVSVGRGQALGQTLSGEQQALAQNVTNALSGQSQQLGASEQAAGLGLTQQGQQITALNNAGNLTSPHFNGYVGIDTTTGNFIGNGQNNAVYGSLIDANAKDAAGFQNNINTIQGDQQGISANFDYLNSAAQGFSSDSPYLTQVQQKYAGTVQGSNIIAQYQQMIASLTTQAAKYGIAIQPNATPSQIQGAQQALNVAMTNQLNNYQKKLNDLKTGQNTTGITNNESNGTYTGSDGKTYKF